MTIQPVLIPSAYLLDLILGDPRWLPHPVRWMGSYVEAFERLMGPFFGRPILERLAGVVLLLSLAGMAFLFPWLLIDMLPPGPFTIAVASLLAYTTIAVRSLHTEAMAVVEALEHSEDEARRRLSMIVGRDTAHLNREEIYRATVETVAENTSDGIIAPLFYLMVGGVPMAMAYRAVNTLDSMVGYRDGRYRYFGWASARMDDLLNLVPARITAALMLSASLLLGLDWRGGLRVVMRDGRSHPSPNAGLPEAVAAGILGVRLGGGAYYRGVYRSRPSIGDDREPLERGKVEDLLRVVHLATLLGVLLFTLLSAIGVYLT